MKETAMTRNTSFEELSDGSLVLTVGKGCIQTAAKRVHREISVALLEGRATTATLGVYADTLERFLSTTDFSVLRTNHPDLAGGTECRVKFWQREDGGVDWEVMKPR
jgi:hypothetical protein